MAILDRTFESYYLEHKLGGGGMGEVYLARRPDGVEVALKLVEMGDDADSRDKVAAERVGAHLQQRFSAVDAHVPAVFRIGEAAGYFFIEMEYVDGHDLAELIPRRVDPRRAARIASEVASFLEHAHAFSATVGERRFAGIVHADLKPKNIRINSGGQVKILDFGISKGLSLTGRLSIAAFGSRSYMSPEWFDSGQPDRHVDFWALGVVLYEMLAGDLPFRADTPRQLELAILARTPPLPLPADCPEAFQRVVLKALAPAVGRRYQTAEAFRTDLEALRDGRPTVAEQEWRTEREAEATRRTRPAPATTGDAEATRRTVPPATADSAPTARTVSPVSPGVPPPAAAPSADIRPAGPRPRSRWRTLVLLAALVVTLNECGAWWSAGTLRGELPASQEAGLGDVWQRYQRIRSRSLLGVARRRVARPVRDTLVTHADRVMADYRRESPSVRQAQWDKARDWLGQAMQVDPGDAGLLARLRLCEAHSLRIDAQARPGGRASPETARLLRDAISRFEEAARLDRSWPDPWLGLLQIYAYSVENADKAAEALNEAERRGFQTGRRESALVGDVNRIVADRTRRGCERLTGDVKCDCFERAAARFQQAISWYTRAEGFAESATALARSQQGLWKAEDARALACAGRSP
jgi:hypothetical protein